MNEARARFLEWMREIERKWQRKWRDGRLFEADANPGRPKFFITVPYPYTNAPLHIGHGRTYTIGDIIARYKRMKGFNVLYPMAFHISGTPIIAISEMISRGDKKTVDAYRKYIEYYVPDPAEAEKMLESFKNPLNLAVFFAERIRDDFESVGFGIDWRRSFHTGEPIYQKFVEWQYSKLHEKGVIKRGDHIVTYCLLHKQPEGEDDIQDADVNPVEIIEHTAVKFKLKDSGEFLLAATLRPETLLGATNLWINPDEMYAVISFGDQALIVSEKSLIKLQHQYPEVGINVVKELKGEELVGKTAISPLGKELVVLPAKFVDADNATGVVYSEPSDAPYDYVALMELKRDPSSLAKYGIDQSLLDSINPIKIIEVPGITDHHAKVVVEKLGIEEQADPRLEEITREVYKEQFYNGKMVVENPDFAGLSVAEAREKMKRELIARGDAVPFYELNRKAKCRAGGDIIVAKIRGQWFLDYTDPDLKERARKFVSEHLRVIPDKYRKAFLDTIDWLEKRPCARRRGLGTPLPWDREWIIESLSDSTIYMAFYTIAHLIRRYVADPSQLSPEFFDFVLLGAGSPDEVSKKTGIPLEALLRMRGEFEYWYPVDQRHTAIPHISNHLTFFILHHMIIFPERHWPRSITLNESVIREGAKMSKSKGNVIPLRDIARVYSADMFRLYIAWAAELGSILDWKEKDVEVITDNLMKFAEISKEAASAECREVPEDIYYKWFMFRFAEEIRAAERSLDAMEIRDYVQRTFFNILKLVEKLSDMQQGGYLCTVRKALPMWIRALYPVIPHLAEEINEVLGSKELLAFSSWPSLVAEQYREIAILVDNVDEVVNDIREVKGLVKKPVRKVYIIVAPEWKRAVLRKTKETQNVKEIIEYARIKLGVRNRELDIVEIVNKFSKSPDERILSTTSQMEYELYKSIAPYLERRTGLQVEVLWEDEARIRNIKRAEKSYPLKPALFLE